MVSWKTDPVYRRIFGEIMDLWRSLDPADRPLALRVEEHSSPWWAQSADREAVHNTWIVDDAGPRMFQGLRGEAYFPGSQRGKCSEFGLIRFCIDVRGEYVAFAYQFGPEIANDSVFPLSIHQVDAGLATPA